MSGRGVFTIEHFEAYTRNLILDTGGQWLIEPFQLEVVEPILFAIRAKASSEVWGILPEGNAKTTLMAGVALYCADYAPLPWIPIAASSRDQAETLAQQAYQMVRSSPAMLSRFRIFEGYRRIQPIRHDHPGHGNRGIKVYASDVGTNDGVIPFPLALCDEGHRWPDLSLYRLWRGKLNKRRAVIAMISTAGEPGGEFEQSRDKIRDGATSRKAVGAHIRYEGHGLVMNEWRVEKASMVTDLEAVKAANPLSTITVATLREEFESPTFDLGDWSRLKCNIPARGSSAAVTESEWEGAYIELPIPAGERIDLGVDVAWKHDTFSIVPCWNAMELFQFRLLGPATILTPPRDGSTLHPDVVKAAFENIFDANPVDTVVMDLGRAEDIASWLEDQHGVTVIDRAQGNALAAEDYEAFMQALRGGTLKHTGHNGLRTHVMNAIARALPGGKRRFDRRSQSRAKRKQDERVIDALAAAGMVNWYQADGAAGSGTLSGDVSDYRIQQL